MSNKKEKIIFEFLNITYGNCILYENEESFIISGFCIYYKDLKQVAWTGLAHLDLVRTFGSGKYQPTMSKWFSEKYNLEVI